jgi:nicotinate-nucleotide adenylyltransferase
MRGFHVYFGGSFDPPHIGHFEILNSLLKDKWALKVHLVPTSRNPFKDVDQSHPLWSDDKARWSWMEALVEDLRESSDPEDFLKLQLESCEFELQKSAFTIDTLINLQEREKRGPKRWVLAMGSDLLASFEKWKNVEALLERLHGVWVFSRGHDTRPQDSIPESLRKLTNFRIMSESITPVSSTDIRALYAAEKSRVAKLLSKKVGAAVL